MFPETTEAFPVPGTGCASVQAARSTRRNCPPPASTRVVTASCGAKRDSRSNSHMAAFSASAWLGQRATTSRPPFRVSRSTADTIGAGSTTDSSGDQATTGLTAPLRVLQARCARRSAPTAALLLFGEAPLSTLGPRSALTDASGSTGSSHSQQRQESRSPTSLRVLMARGYGSPAANPTCLDGSWECPSHRRDANPDCGRASATVSGPLVNWDDVGVDEHLIVRVSAKAVLLDMDGVLVDSTGLVEKHWSQWAERRGLDAATVLRFAHGSPSREVVARFVSAEDVPVEAAWVDDLALRPTDEVPLPGARAVLTQRVLPVAVVTSATHAVARLRLTRAGLPVPAVLIGADDVARGKPDPLPYLRAAQLLQVPASDCVAVEDTPAGLASIRAAGAKPLALLTSHRADELSDALALLADLRSLRVLPAGVGWDREEVFLR